METPESTNYQKVVELFQMEFWDGWIAKKATCRAVVMTSKVRCNLWVIIIVVFFWNTVAAILNRCLWASINLDNVPCGF